MKPLAARTAAFTPSAVREILKVAEAPDVLSFAGGLPAPELFPLEALADAHARVFSNVGPSALQYSTTEGAGPLREWIASDLTQRGVPTTADDVLITHGSQQGIDLAARVFVDPGAVVVTENPTYLAALQVFQGAQATVIGVESDGDGMKLEALAEVLATSDVRLIYVVPTFANPTGRCWSTARRAGLVALAQAHGVPVLEDDPYSALRFEGPALPPLASLSPEHVVTLGTFSKTLAPGLRLGWLRARPDLRRLFVVASQAAGLHPSTLSQRAVIELLSRFDFDAHLARLREVYGERCRVMAEAVRRDFPAGTTVSSPRGGLFLWAQLPASLDTAALLPTLVRTERVAYVPGAPFFVGPAPTSTVRLNFSNRSPVELIDGVARLGRAFSAQLASALEHSA